MDEDIKNKHREDPAIEELQKIVERLEKEKSEYLTGWQRAKADFINYKKEEAQRLEEFMKFSTMGIVDELLHVVDSFDLGLATIRDAEAIRGMQLIRAQLEEALRKYGLEKITVHKGKPFDPKFEEALGEVLSEEKEGMVAEEVSKGYTIHGKVVRPARVMISKGQNK